MLARLGFGCAYYSCIAAQRDATAEPAASQMVRQSYKLEELSTLRTVVLVMLFIWALTGGALAQGGATYGTVNILISNMNGTVLVTDSRLTVDDGSGRYQDTGQKLFELDSNTVCSFAGLASDPGLFPELSTETGGLIRGYGETLLKRSGSPEERPLTFKEKVNTLTGLLLNDYFILMSAHVHAERVEQAKVREIQLLVVGYDIDGSEKAAKVIINIDPDHSLATTATVDIQALGGQFVFLTAGYDHPTQLRLQHPELFSDIEALKWYNAAIKEGRAAQLSLSQLEVLADYLEKDAAGERIIGGPVQSATLQNHSVDVKPVKGLALPRVPRKVLIINDVGLTNSIVPLVLAKGTDTLAYIDDNCTNASVTLDQGVFYEGVYDHCLFLFNGGFFRRDKTVSIIGGGKLVLGPDMQADDPKVASALKQFPELTPVSYQTLHLPAEVRNEIWAIPPK